MRTRHAAGLDETPQIPATGAKEVDESLVGLREEPDQQGDPEGFRKLLLP